MAHFCFKVLYFVCAFGFLFVEGAEIVGRWSLDDLVSGQLVESLSQNTSSTILVARKGATNTRSGVLNVEDVNYLSFAVPNGECVVDDTKCGKGIGVSFWMRYKGFISDIVKEDQDWISKLDVFLADAVEQDLRWINCFRASEHGWAASTFHNKCDFKGPTLTLVQVKNGKFIFGGFTDLDWGGSIGFKKSNNSFLFTLVNNDGKTAAKMTIQNNNSAIYNSPSHGPWFGTTDLIISDMAAENLNSTSRPGASYTLPSGVTAGSVDAVNLLAGSEYFVPDNMEVFYIECFNPLGMQNGEISDEKITTISNDPTKPRLNDPSGSVWSPQSAPVVPIVVIDLVSVRRIVGMDAHGNKDPNTPGYPTDFQVEYVSKLLPYNWTVARSAMSLDDESSVKRFILPSFTARKLKVVLNQCVGICGFAMEIYGCSAESCNQALHMETITASSFSSPGYEPANARLDANKCWKPSSQNNSNDYLQVDLGRVRILTKLVTRGYSAYKIQYSTDGDTWDDYLDLTGTAKLFEVPYNTTSVTLEPVVQVRFIRLFPVSGRCLKLELYGCTAFKGSGAYSGILSSGNDVVDGTGLLIYYLNGAFRGEYKATDKRSQSKASVPSTEWTRITFVRKDNGDPWLVVDNIVSNQNDYPSESFSLNSPAVINLASTLSSHSPWTVENIQLSDLSLWTDIPRDPDDWDKTKLPADLLDLCNFDGSPCAWKIGNWTKGTSCVPSNSLGTGPCKGAAGTGFLYLESSYPRSKGTTAIFESPYVVKAYHCVAFQYHMWGIHAGRLDVLYAGKLRDKDGVLKWRLSGNQGNSWNEGKFKLQQNEAFKVIFKAIVGDGYLGDIAIDEVVMSTSDQCSLLPSHAKPGVSAFLDSSGLSKSAIIGHLSTLKTFLKDALAANDQKDNSWVPCYRALADGRDVSVFHSKCTGRGATVTIVRAENYIFGGYTDVDWGSEVSVSFKAFLFSLNNKEGTKNVFHLNPEKRYKAHFMNQNHGPTFGEGDLVLDTMSTCSTQLGNSFGNSSDGGFQFGDSNYFAISDVEVLYIGDTSCDDQCNHAEGLCDNVTGKCVCNWSERNVAWCVEGEPQKVLNLYQDAASFWPLDSLEDPKDRKRLGWGKNNGGVSLDPKGLSGHALQFDGETGWVDLGSLDTACPGVACVEDFSISMWFKYHHKENPPEEQTFLTFDNGMTKLELGYKSAPFFRTVITLNTTTFSAWYEIEVEPGLWCYLGFSWDDEEKSLTIQKNDDILPTDIKWYACHACEHSISNNTSVTLGAGSFPNASFDEIGIWLQPLEKQRFIDIYETYKGPPRLHAELSIQFTSSWNDQFNDPESTNYRKLLQDLRDKISEFYSSVNDVSINSQNINISLCWNDNGSLSCNLTLYYYSSGYKQLGLLLRDLLPHVNLPDYSPIVLLGSKINNVPSSPAPGLTARATGPSSAEVSWETPPDTDIPGIFTGYAIYYKEVASDSDFWFTGKMWNTNTFYNLLSLNDYTNYTVNVTVLSLEGEGIPATVYVMTGEGAPPRPTVNMTASNASSTSIHIKWDAPEGPIPGVIRGYRIFYTKAEDVINETMYTTIDNITITNYIAKESTLLNETIYDVGLLQYNITGLEVYTNYCLWITAFTIADSPNSESLCVLTDESVPDQAPSIADINPVTNKECNLSWVPIPPEHHKGVLLGYRIVYAASDSVDNSNTTVDTSTTRNVPVGNLRPYTHYLIKVGGFTSKGDGNFSDPESCLTYEDVPSRPPADIQINNVNTTQTSCGINWGPVPAEHQNGDILGYELMYAMSSQQTMQQSFNLTNLTVDTYSYVLNGLDTYTEYNISIVGMTSAGKGAHSQESAVTCLTKPDYPPVSPTGLSVVATTSESCQIYWNAVSDQDAKGEVTGYEVFVVKIDSVEQGLEIKLDITRVHLCGTSTGTNVFMLDAFTLYSIKIAVRNDGGKGNFSETLGCITNESAPSLPPQNIRGHNTSSQTIMVMWDPVLESNRHGIVRAYNISIWPVNSPSRVMSYVDTSGNLSVELGGLQPYTNYSIVVAAHTVATGSFSDPVIVITGEAAPTTAPQIVQSYNTSGRSIFVQWTPPQEPIPGIVRGYRILYTNVNVPGSPTKNETLDTSTLSYELTWLEIYTRYEIAVLAFTVADGPPSNPRVVYTDNKILPPPDGVTETVATGDTTPTSCELIWEEVVNSDPDPDGAVTGYLIYYRKAGSNDSFDKMDVPGANTTAFTMENLEEFTNYELKIVAYNYYGEGNASEVSHCLTEEDVPSSSPVNMTSIHITSRGIELKWDMPPEENWNGIIRGFIIMYYRKDEGNSSARYVKVPAISGGLSSADLSWSLTGLDPFTLYVLRVLAYTIGNSDYSPDVEIRTAEEAPSSPPTGIMAAHNGSATSLWIEWSEVPYADQNGIIRGFIIGYWVKDDPGTATYVNITESSVSTLFRRKRAAVASYMRQLTGLRIWTKYLVTIAAYTVSQGPDSEPYMVRTDEGVPCMPPQYVTYDIPGLSMLLAKWKPVPVHCHNGIILGYRVRYQRLDGVSPVRIENTTADGLYAFLYDMDIYHNYSIETIAFTRKGESNATRDVAQPDSLGTKKTPINITAQNYTSTSSINITWKPIEDDLILERMLGYRISYRAVSIGDEEFEEEQPTYNFTVRKTTLQAVIEGLDTYIRYQINVSGFTRRGNGPYAITAGETCRCHERLTTNYRLFPPYVDQLEVTDDGHITVANMTGMLPAILNDLVITCCGTCDAHGTSYVDFKYNGTNGTAKQNSEQEIKTLIEDRNDLSFPVYGWKWQEHYGAIYRYIPLVESPGVAFIVIEDEVLSPSERLIKEVFATWPYIIITTLFSALAGIVIWLLDRNSNPDEFPPSFCRGAWNGFWWAFISMTTLGYGDKVPRANVSKMFAIFWILMGLVLMQILTSALTSAVTLFVFNAKITLYGTKVAVIQDTPEYRLAVSKNAKVNQEKNYTTFAEVYDALVNEEVRGMLIDTHEAGSKRDRFKDPRIHIRTIFDYKSTYGVVLAGNSTKLMHCSKSYMQSHKAEMYDHIGKFIHSIKEEQVPESESVASGLFNPQNNTFRYFVFSCGALLAMAVILGVIWEFRRKIRAREASRLYGDPNRAKTRELLQEMKKSVDEFCFTFKANYHGLSKKHRAQLKSLKTQQHAGRKPDTNV